MTLFLNILWVVLGGFIMALAWWLVALVLAITIIGLPWARAAFMLGTFTLWPFGREMVDRRLATGRDDVGTGAWGMVGNVLWFLVAGFGLAVGHVVCAVACAVTIIGLPFAWIHVKLALASLAPIGKEIVRTTI